MFKRRNGSVGLVIPELPGKGVLSEYRMLHKRGVERQSPGRFAANLISEIVRLKCATGWLHLGGNTVTTKVVRGNYT
jgi:hypothetical protein